MEIAISIFLGLFVIFAGLFYSLFLNKEFNNFDDENKKEGK